jgi:hypothetical protein
MEYEKAGELKQKLADLARLQRKARKMFNFPDNRKLLVFLRAYNEDGFNLFYIDNGVVMQTKRFSQNFRSPEAADFTKAAINEPCSGPEWMKDAILEIIADKLFVILPRRCSAEQIEKALTVNGQAFCK